MHLTHALHRHLRQFPQACAACDDNRMLNWVELVDRVARFAGAVRRDALQPGDRVAMLARNDIDYLIYVFGTLWAGGVINPVDWRWDRPGTMCQASSACAMGLLQLMRRSWKGRWRRFQTPTSSRLMA